MRDGSALIGVAFYIGAAFYVKSDPLTEHARVICRAAPAAFNRQATAGTDES